MGRIFDGVAVEPDTPPPAFTNKVDQMLDDLDDDVDRRVVLGWLLGRMGEEEVEQRLLRHQIVCSDSTIRRWRRYQRSGLGRVWAA